MRTLALALLLALPAVACREKPKRVVRTEPWLAPVVSASSASASAAGKPLRYALEQSTVEFELPARRGKPRGKLGRVEGTIEFDPVHLEQSRARLTVDLLSMSMSGADGDDAPLLARAFDWLELSAEHAPVDRAGDRYAVLNITALETAGAPDEAGLRRTARVTAHGDLTLHHFRVPVAVELDVELKTVEGGGPGPLMIRTHKPLVVSLAAHDILPRDARGNVLTNQLSALGTEVGREARVTAQLLARPSPLPEPTNP